MRDKLEQILKELQQAMLDLEKEERARRKVNFRRDNSIIMCYIIDKDTQLCL